MTAIELYLSQISDPFRIGLLVVMLLTAANTARAMPNRWLPIAFGVVFVAVLIPLSLGRSDEVSGAMAIATGLVANISLVVVMLALALAFQRLRLR